MVQQVKTPKSEDLSSIPGTYIVEGEKPIPLSCPLIYTHVHGMCPPPTK